MNTPYRRNQPEPAEPMFRYVMWFVAAIFVSGLAVGLAELILPNWKLVKVLAGLAIVFVSGEFARGRFFLDHNRSLRGGERWALFLGSEVVLFVLGLVTALFMIKAYNSSFFAFRKVSLGLAFPIAFFVGVFYSPVLWFSYWFRNARDAVDEQKPADAPRIKLLLIGSGGREHALAWKLAQSRRVSEIIIAPGNAGTAREPKCRNVEVAVDDIDGLLALAQRERIGLTIVGPEGPLVAGVVNRFRAAGLRIFGPSQAAAQLEGSKAFAKEFLARHGIPTAHYAVHTELASALAYLREKGAPIVIKADGLAAGKGVVVATTLAEAEAAVTDMLAGNAFGAAGARVVIEEFLDGEEASFISIVDGASALAMATSQDHKRVADGDTGPNTGGMGAYSPAPVVTPTVHARVMREIVLPTVRGMAADGMPFTGFLYAGLMIDPNGVAKVIEFNVRFGDPETQPVMLRLKSDLLDLLEAAVDGILGGIDAEWNPRPALGVVMAAANYPDTPRTGDSIQGLDTPAPMGSKLFHAGTRLSNGAVVTSGGRVLCACALGDTVLDAQRNAYALVAQIAWDGEFHRQDIGWRAIARERG